MDGNIKGEGELDEIEIRSLMLMSGIGRAINPSDNL